ncbi:MAG: TonB-dependent receptor plug [Mucilaginibacter sp.]|nr:TonB-dependent receptor plug [Mucilaginibacter sp.]
MKQLLLQFGGMMGCHPPRAGAGRHLKRGIICVILLFLINASAFAQNNQVTGHVTDATGQALPGVSVKIKGSTAGAVTTADGRYSITVADPAASLVFSFVGFASQEIKINGQSVIDVQMREDAKSLNEVVVIGYQTVRRRDLTGAVASVSPEEANRVTATSVAESLQGLSPGITVRSGGAPGQQAQIDIRGVASFSSATPLYVIDGMIADANTTVNNDDIESIQVLKDASASAIYGSRAANGVIIITTKQGKKGAAKITFSAKYGIQKLPKKWDVMNSSQYAAMKRQEYTNSGTPIPASIGSGFNAAINTDWQSLDEKTGNDQDYNVTLSGGSDDSKYLISGSYYDNQGTLKAYNFNRTSIRVNTQTKKGILTFGENILFTNTNNYHPNRGNPFYDLPQSLPTVPVQDPRFIDLTTNYAPLGARNPKGYSTGTSDGTDVTYATNMIAANDLSQGYNNYAKLLGNAFAQLRLFDWLDYKFNIGLEASFDYNRDLRKDGILTYAQQQELSYIDEDRERYTNLLMEHTFNFNKTFGRHNINGVLGFTQQRYGRQQTDARKTGLQTFNGQALTQINSAIGTPSVIGQVLDLHKIQSYLGRVNYTFNDRYLLTASARIDQDSYFSANHRTGFFPSVAGAWRISKESFFKADWVNDLKINASYGVLGINTIGAFQNVGLINSNQRAIFGSAQTPVVGASQATLSNPDLRWEKRQVTNVGVDGNFFNNVLSVSVSVYHSLSKDVLLGVPLTEVLGNLEYNPPVNAGSISNKGIEFQATYRNSNNEFKWSVTGNFTTIKNKVESVGNQGGVNYIQVGSTRSQVGYALGQWYVLKDIGIFQSQAEVNNYKRNDGTLIEPFAKPGDVKFAANPNGTGTINNNDRVFNGSPWPTLQTGLQFNGSYKQFSVSLQMVGVFGLKIYDDVRRTLDSYQNSNFRTAINPWTPGNTNTTDPRLGLAGNDPGIASNNTPESSRWLENGSYARIRNLEIGYQLPKDLVQRFKIDNARIFISGQNLLTVTKYKGLDPDVVGNTNDGYNGILSRGVDAGNYPPNRIFSLGINCGF